MSCPISDRLYEVIFGSSKIIQLLEKCLIRKRQFCVAEVFPMTTHDLFYDPMWGPDPQVGNH